MKIYFMTVNLDYEIIDRRQTHFLILHCLIKKVSDKNKKNAWYVLTMFSEGKLSESAYQRAAGINNWFPLYNFCFNAQILTTFYTEHTYIKTCFIKGQRSCWKIEILKTGKRASGRYNEVVSLTFNGRYYRLHTTTLSKLLKMLHEYKVKIHHHLGYNYVFITS